MRILLFLTKGVTFNIISFMKVLLVSINASYMHTNVAIRSLKAYAEKKLSGGSMPEIQCVEYTINQPVGEVLRGIGFTGADMVLFSTYIWNAEYVCKILPDVKKILPSCVIGAGGPEFGYAPEKYLNMMSTLDFVMYGEGEESFTQLMKENSPSVDVSKIKGIYYRNPENKKIEYTGNQPLIENIDELPFPYPEILAGDFDPDHKIYYYESTRGCPFGCAYCLSSVDKRVRFKSLPQVQKELQIFLDADIKLVKFIDRTYNLNPDRYIPIWQYILEHHNGKTMFHFGIEAEYLSDEALEFLQKIPEGIMQFEMGVQSANKETLRAVNRSDNIEVLAKKIQQIPRTIHQHLDLIAGLPYEDLESFGRSYDYVMSLKPDALQLGFLKVLNGTQMADFAAKNGWKWMENPFYETFSTPYLSFENIAYLKNVEIATDAYWNKGTFASTMNYIFRHLSPWAFMCTIVDFGEKQGAFTQARKESYWFELIFNCISEIQLPCTDSALIKDLLRYDFVRSGKKGNFPSWYQHIYDKDKHRELLENQGLLNNSRIAFSVTEYEEFDYDVMQELPENYKGHCKLLIKYQEK